jgi:hypothetical protein
MPTTIAERDEVRRLAGMPLPARVPDSVIDEQIKASDTIVKLFTMKEDWDNTYMEWDALKQASELIASSYIRQMFKEKDESDRQNKEAMQLLELINRRSENAGKRQTVIKHRPYRTPALNPTGGLYYSSVHKKDFVVGSGGEGVESPEPWR